MPVKSPLNLQPIRTVNWAKLKRQAKASSVLLTVTAIRLISKKSE